MTVDSTLAERGARYGKFIEHAEIAQALQAVMHKMPNWASMDYDMRQALCVIADKIARIGNGDPFYADNWHDIQGYAKLVEARILDLEKAAEKDKAETVVQTRPTFVVDGKILGNKPFDLEAVMAQLSSAAKRSGIK